MNAYAIYKKQDGSYCFNPNCYLVTYKKGQVTPSGLLCIEDNVSLEYAEKFIRENKPNEEVADLFSLIFPEIGTESTKNN